MSFNQVGRFFLKRNESTWVTLTFGVGEDKGALWIMAHPEVFSDVPGRERIPNWGTSQLEVSRFQKRVDLPRSTGGAYVTYNCLVTNNGNNDTIFSLQGGGNI